MLMLYFTSPHKIIYIEISVMENDASFIPDSTLPTKNLCSYYSIQLLYLKIYTYTL